MIMSATEWRGPSEAGAQTLRFCAASEAVLFSFSDRPVQEKLDLWREQRPA